MPYSDEIPKESISGTRFDDDSPGGQGSAFENKQSIDPCTVPKPPPDPEPALDIPGYKLLGELGQGGMGIVYKVQDEKLGRELALKIMKNGNGIGKERFIREARAMAELRHDNIVPLYDYGEHPCLYYTMPLYNDGSLKKKLENGALSEDQATKYLLAITKALNHMHQKGLVHRDLKPDNILFDGEKPLVTDFGLVLNPDNTRLTMTGGICGTPLYLSPEQAVGNDVDFRSDLFSLGIVLYRMLAGKHLFSNSTERPRDFILGKIEPFSSSPLYPIMKKLLEVEKENRYSSTRELLEAIENISAPHAAPKVIENISPPSLTEKPETNVVRSALEAKAKQLAKQYEKAVEKISNATGPGSKRIAELEAERILQQLEETQAKLNKMRE